METQKKNDAYSANGFCGHFNTVFEAMGCCYQYCQGQEALLLLSEEEIRRCNKERALHEKGKQNIRKVL